MIKKNIEKGRKGRTGPALLILLLWTLLFAMSAACTTMSKIDYEGNRKLRIEKSANYKKEKFVNRDGVAATLNDSTWNTMKKMLFGNQQRVPEKPLEVKKINPKLLTGGAADELKITWLGHSFTIIEIEGSLVLTDPMLGKRPSPFPFMGPKRYHKELPIEVEEFPEIDLVIISHDHYDHLDYGTIKKLHTRVKHFIVPLGVGAYLEKWGVPEEKITGLDWWQQTTTAKGLKVAAAPAQHFSGRNPFNRNDTLWASWAIMGKKHRVFFSGDGGYTPAFKEIGFEYGPFDVTLMENGQYNKAWQRVHMLPEQSLQAHIDVRGKVMIPVHWGAYNLSIHDWTEPVERLLKAAAGTKVRVATPRIGETWTYGDALPAVKWWLDISKKKRAVVKGSKGSGEVALSEK